MPQTAGEWAQVLQLQRQFHQVQLSKWQQILQSSVTLLDQVGVFLFFVFKWRTLQIPFCTCLLRHYWIITVYVLISLILYISDEAVFRKAPQRYQGPRVAAGCSWWSPHRDPNWGLSLLLSTSDFFKAGQLGQTPTLLDHSNKSSTVGPQLLRRYCMKTGHWWASLIDVDNQTHDGTIDISFVNLKGSRVSNRTY